VLAATFEADESCRLQFVEVVRNRRRNLRRTRDVAADFAGCWADDPAFVVHFYGAETTRKKAHDLEPSRVAQRPMGQDDHFVIHRNEYTGYFGIFRNEFRNSLMIPSPLALELSECEVESARRLILRFGWNSTCYQILNPGMQHWFGPDGQSLVGFMRVGTFAIVAGAPVCDEDRLLETVLAWETFATNQGWRVIYFGAESRLQKCLRDRAAYRQVNLGCQPEWMPSQFCLRFDQDRSLRAQRNRARNKGVMVREWSVAEAQGRPELEAILQNWLRTRGLPPMHFLVEPQILGWLGDRRIFVAEQHSRPIGFVSLIPVPSRDGWLSEHFLRSDRGPNGTVEAMLYAAARAVADEGARYWTMGIVPLVQDGSFAEEPKWLTWMRQYTERRLTRFYNFRGLGSFKAKLHPTEWKPIVVIVRDEKIRFKHLRAIVQAFTKVAPELALVGGIWRTLRRKIEADLTGRRLR
jgi:phosphatidylglycerol lysyltransferase